MPKKRRLGDLYVVGKKVLINDDSGEDPVEVWLQKLNPVEAETCARKAGSARARYLAHKKDKESEEYRSAMSDALDFTNRNLLIDMVARDELLVRRTRIESELAADEEWAKDDYLQGLYDAWNGLDGEDGLGRRHEADPDDPEANRVFEELKRFTDLVDRQMVGERDEVRRDYENTSDEELLERGVERIIENRAVSNFMDEYESERIFCAVREVEDHRKRYFERREEVDALYPEVRRQLLDHLRMLEVSRDEGKDSRGTPASSSSSGPSETGETAPSSGLVAVSP